MVTSKTLFGEKAFKGCSFNGALVTYMLCLIWAYQNLLIKIKNRKVLMTTTIITI